MAETKQKSKKTRRGRGEGSIRWIERIQKYEIRYTVGVDENGKPITKYGYYKKKSEALAVLRDALVSVGKGTYVDPSEESLYSCCLNWYELYKEPSITRVNTKKKYRTSLNRIHKMSIATVPLKDLNTELLQRSYNELKKHGASESTIKITHTLIKDALAHAKKTNKIRENYALDIIIPKDEIVDEEDKNVRALTDEQLDIFLKEMEKSNYYMFALFMSKTGLRPGEAIALNRNDLLFGSNKVRVAKTYLKEAKNKVQEATKTASSKRTIPVPSSIMSLMKKYMLQQPNQDKSAPLFQTLAGTRISPRNALRQFKAVGERIGCPWVNLHTMRHTFASKLFKEGIDPKVISKLLGHKSVKTTCDIYIHFIDNIVDESVQVLNDGIPEDLPDKTAKKKKDNVVELKKAN